MHAFNKARYGRADQWHLGGSKLSVKQKAALKDIAEEGPDLALDGVVRWCCRDLV